jgi:hypothetical protein
MAKERVLVSQELAPYNTKSEGATFVRQGDDVMAHNTADTIGALTTTRVSTKDIRELVHKYLTDLVRIRVDALDANRIIADELERRVAVAVKNAAPRMERMIEESIASAVLERAREVVNNLKIDACVVVQQPDAAMAVTQ